MTKLEQRKQVAKKIEDKDSRQNGMKTICTTSVLESLGCSNWKYSQNTNDVLRVLRNNGWAVRSRKSQTTKKIFKVCHIKHHLQRFSLSGGLFVVFVEGHVLLLNRDGKTIVDTAPRKVDKRRIVNIYEVYRR